MRHALRKIALICLAVFCLGPLSPGLAAGEAPCLTGAGNVSVPLCLNREGAERITDGNSGTYARVPGLTGISVSLAEAPDSVSLSWRTAPKRFLLRQYDGTGRELSRQTVENGPLCAVYPLLADARRIRITGGDLLLELCDLAAYGPGDLPEEIHPWRAAPDKTDLLIVSAHCDDELLFFGGAIPYYAGELGYAVEVIYMAHGDRVRQEEALSGLWTCRMYNAPVFLGLRDEYCLSLEEAERYWDREKVTETLVELLRRLRPEVVMTHDEGGEYGHGAHRLTSACVLDAVKLAGEETAFPASKKQYGVWQVKKLYRHLGPMEGRTRIDWNIPLAAFGGKTALAVAEEGFQNHSSQFDVYDTVYNPGLHSDWFQLAYSAVGPDEEKNDLFEHIPADCITVGKE